MQYIAPTMQLPPADHELLRLLGARVRDHRLQRGWTVKELAARSELSPRFLSDLEAGRANIAVGRLARVAAALAVSMSSLMRDAKGPRAALNRLLDGLDHEQLQLCLRAVELVLGTDGPRAICLLGLRGAGKSTLGPKLAAALGLPFIELDERIEQAAGLVLSEIFALHGEPYYRRLEARCLLEQLMVGQPGVIALSGGVVHNDEAFRLVLNHSMTVCLRARPEDHMQRVIDQGDMRPIDNRRDAMAELRALLRSRAPLYGQADFEVDTSENDVDQSLQLVMGHLVRQGWPAADQAAWGSDFASELAP